MLWSDLIWRFVVGDEAMRHAGKIKPQRTRCLFRYAIRRKIADKSSGRTISCFGGIRTQAIQPAETIESDASGIDA